MPHPTRRPRHAALRAVLPVALACFTAAAQAAAGSDGKLLLTGGVSSIDGAAGGGLTPWAVTGSYASRGQVGATAHITRVRTQDYGLTTGGVAISFSDRVEASIARQNFDTGPTGVALGLPGLHLRQDIIGFKARVLGDAVLDSDRWLPQVAFGVEIKRSSAGDLAPTLKVLGARDTGTDWYVSATKLFLAPGVLVNATLRSTKANQNGLLGFGGTQQSGAKLQPEISLAYLLNKHLAIGAEWRAKPDNLNPSTLGAALKEDDWADLFVAWAPNKHLSLTLAYVDLGHIVPGFVPRRQTGGYLSAQLAF